MKEVELFSLGTASSSTVKQEYDRRYLRDVLAYAQFLSIHTWN
jgi:hypothetical protein